MMKPLPDYLWGIETGDKRQIYRRRMESFQTTYEELKLIALAVGGVTESSSFQTTYEELKL